MKFEKLNVDTNKRGIWILYGLILGVVLIIIINYFISMAKYKVVDTTKLVSSNINYKLPDLTILGIYVKDKGDTDYKYVESVPSGNYTVNTEKSYCLRKGSNDKITDAIKYDENGLYIGIDERGTRCKVYLDKEITSKDTLDKLTGLSVNTVEQGCPAIEAEGISTNQIDKPETERDLLCEGQDDYGITYYFRGNVTNNWVKIEDTYWRIIRINGNGTIRLIYNGSGTSDSDTGIVSITTYNTSSNDNKYVGFMYGNTSRNYTEAHTNTTPSSILDELKTWWTGNEFPTTFKQYVDGATGFCNDRESYTGTTSDTKNNTTVGFGSTTTQYGSYIRIITNKKPSFKCPQKNDLFTSEGENGNKALNNIDGEKVPVGLITADEVMYAGSGYGSSTANKSYYLYNRQFYWTMSPSHTAPRANVFFVSNSGPLIFNDVTLTTPGVRPVINLKADTPFEPNGDGSSGNPFVVKLT